ncbi:CobW family GTP-binding protein [Aliiruegeria sabulilitoris]|uniref:CobW family GTP-binding protein n=1 Tax=Aliiruegeria sabulilitoris TaxID=1510458 RepID=UPI000830C7F6|nr:GTP-binding protein [Aliiruegeria sabulilitoris]NDR56606.1 GTP-binding protein [Pseudoruegeria sp. M32A2M]
MIEFGSASAVPVTILTGFLGAGKTTLLNRILTGNHGLRVAVLVNDFGSINVDADLVVGIEDDVMSLANGCVCCSIRDDLIETVEAVLARPERPEYILLEASGVSDPFPIAMTFTDQRFRDKIRLDSIICLVDAEQVFAAPEQMELKLRQIAFSDMVILNKVDLVEQESVQKVHDWLTSRFRRYRLVEAVNADVPLEILLSVRGFAAEQLNAEVPDHHEHGPGCGCDGHDHTHGHDHAAHFSTTMLRSDRPVPLAGLREAIKRLPGEVYRVKGFVLSEEDPDHRIVVQVVGKRIDIAREEPWGDRTPETRLVAIGAPGAVSKEMLEAVFLEPA